MQKKIVFIFLFFFYSFLYSNYSSFIVNQLQLQDAYFKEHLLSLELSSRKGKRVCDHSLLTSYNVSFSKIPHVSLASLPSPVQRLYVLEKKLGIKKLYIKRDGLIGPYDENHRKLFGGNKIRKLEFLLADALAHGATHVITFGCLGSNHVAATAAMGQLLGLHVRVMLLEQSITSVVRHNVLVDLYHHAQISFCDNRVIRTLGAAYQVLSDYHKTGFFPYVIPTGGSNEIGVLGFVNAAFELKKQIDQGLLEEPDVVYVPYGSGGTVAGLALGCTLAGLKTHIIGVLVEKGSCSQACNLITKLINDTIVLLQRYDSNFIMLQPNNFEICKSDTVGEYGEQNMQSACAQMLFLETENIQLDPTYTCNAAEMLCTHANSKKLDRVVLFWNTFNEQFYDQNILEKQIDKLPYSIKKMLT